LRSKFYTVTGRMLRIAAFGIDLQGHHTAQVLAFTRSRKGRRIFACRGVAGPKPIWPGRASRAKTGDVIYNLGVDSAKDAIYARLNIAPPEPGQNKPGFIHFPVADNFGPEYFEQLNSERRVVRKRLGQTYIAWEQGARPQRSARHVRRRAGDAQGAAARDRRGLEYSVTHDNVQQEIAEPSQAPNYKRRKPKRFNTRLLSVKTRQIAPDRAKSRQTSLVATQAAGFDDR
jgi:phage terminase large subunit GpA-like protein